MKLGLRLEHQLPCINKVGGMHLCQVGAHHEVSFDIVQRVMFSNHICFFLKTITNVLESVSSSSEHRSVNFLYHVTNCEEELAIGERKGTNKRSVVQVTLNLSIDPLLSTLYTSGHEQLLSLGQGCELFIW